MGPRIFLLGLGRIPGHKNHDFEETRQRLAQQVATQLLASAGTQPSLHALASGVGVDPGTLRHYFTDRRGVVQAAFESLLPMGGRWLAATRALGDQPAPQALAQLMGRLAEAWPGMVGGMHGAGFSEGMLEPSIGQSYVSSILEPTLGAVEQLLAVFHGRGELNVPDPRVGALALMAPVLFALFHQHQLGGARCRPLELKPFLEAHLRGFLAGYGPPPRSTKSPKEK